MNRRLWIIVAIYVVIVLVYAALRPAQIDWTPTYERSDKIPYGTYVLFQEMEHILSPEMVNVENLPLYNHMKDSELENGLFLSINEYFYADRLDVKALWGFVERGNTAFISAQHISEELLERLQVIQETGYNYSTNPAEWMYHPNLDIALAAKEDSTWAVATRYLYTYLIPDTIQLIDEDTTAELTLDTLEEIAFVELGQTDGEYANFVKYTIGEGDLYLHCIPQTFSNYYVLGRPGRTYTSLVLSHLPENANVIWDEYYKGRGRGNSNPLNALGRHTSFRWAYWVAVVTAILFMIFTARRKQRVIPVIAPPRNSSLDFITTIGDLYYQTGDHTDLAKKKLQYFRSHAKAKYRLEITDFSNEERDKLAIRSARDKDLVGKLLNNLRMVQNATRITSSQLVTLQKLLDNFYERKE